MATINLSFILNLRRSNSNNVSLQFIIVTKKFRAVNHINFSNRSISDFRCLSINRIRKARLSYMRQTRNSGAVFNKKTLLRLPKKG